MLKKKKKKLCVLFSVWVGGIYLVYFKYDLALHRPDPSHAKG